MTLREKLERFFSIIYQAWQWARFALAMAVTFLVLFYVPWVLAGWGWDSPMARTSLYHHFLFAGMAVGAWYALIFVIARPLWYTSWANAAIALDMSLRYFESRR